MTSAVRSFDQRVQALSVITSSVSKQHLRQLVRIMIISMHWTRLIAITVVAMAPLMVGCQKCSNWAAHCPLGDLCTPGHSNAIPDSFPLGSINRAHYHTMETNAEATDFILHRYDFIGSTAELTPSGKDHVLEVAARMRQAPFPVLIERSLNNADPELDEARREIIVRILNDLGNPDANQRTIISQPYTKGLNSNEGVQSYLQFQSVGGNNQFGGSGGGGQGGFGASF